MAAPTAPSNLADGDPIVEGWVDAVSTGLAFALDDRFVIRIGQGQTIGYNAFEAIDFSDGGNPAAFNTSPSYNVPTGAWLPQTSGSGIIIPDTGLYVFVGHGQFPASAGGTRGVQITDGGAEDGASRSRGPTSGTSAPTSMTSVLFRRFSAGDHVGMEAFQDQTSAGSLASCIFTLSGFYLVS